MIASLTVKNIALIEAVTIEFEEGFNVLSGETGAGKSIIIVWRESKPRLDTERL